MGMLRRIDDTVSVDPARVVAVRAQIDGDGMPNPHAGSVIVLQTPKGNAFEKVKCRLSPDQVKAILDVPEPPLGPISA